MKLRGLVVHRQGVGKNKCKRPRVRACERACVPACERPCACVRASAPHLYRKKVDNKPGICFGRIILRGTALEGNSWSRLTRHPYDGSLLSSLVTSVMFSS